MGLSLKDLPFRRLVQKNSDLAAIRREYQSAPTEVRRMAAQREYDSGCAAEILDETMLRMLNSDGFRLSAGRGPCPGAVLALAIDPTCAPALLTVGVAEYQLGRVDDAMELFLTLTTLPDDTEDLSEIIDQAGDFLLDRKDYLNAKTLYAAAAEQYADVSVYHTGLWAIALTSWANLTKRWLAHAGPLSWNQIMAWCSAIWVGFWWKPSYMKRLSEYWKRQLCCRPAITKRQGIISKSSGAE